MFHVLVAVEEEALSRIVNLFDSHQFPHIIKFSTITGFDEYNLWIKLDYQLPRYVEPWIRQYLVPFGLTRTRVLSEAIQMNLSGYKEKQPSLTLGDLRKMGKEAVGIAFSSGVVAYLIVAANPLIAYPFRSSDPILEENRELSAPDDEPVRILNLEEYKAKYPIFLRYMRERFSELRRGKE